MSVSRLDVAYLLKVLRKRGLITSAQEKLIKSKAHLQWEKLAQVCEVRSHSSSGQKTAAEITPVEILASMEVKQQGKGNCRLDEDAIMRAVAEELGMTFKKIDPLELDLEVVTQTIPKSFALKHLVLPAESAGDSLTVLVCDPFNRQVLEDIERVTNKRVLAQISTKSDILKTVTEFYGFKSSIVAADSQLGMPLVDLGNLERFTRVRATGEISSSEQHITNAVDYLFNYAFEQRASDVHIEPKRQQASVRLRIDGLLHTIYRVPKSVHPAIISRIKGLARLDVAEKRRPQDGRIKVERSGIEAEIRVSTVPVAFGEKAVLRIFDVRLI